jgi:histidine phosphotransferase ChpT
MGETRAATVELAERVADRLCHDISSSAQALASGLDLLSEARTDADRDEAVAFLGDALAAQKFKVGYARRAYGLGSAASAAELRPLAETLYADLRPSLDWAVGAPALGPAAARVLLLLLQIAADALAVGGIARARSADDGSVVAVDMAGGRIALKDEVLAGLAGEPFGAGLGGRWVQGAFVAALAAQVGGRVEVELGEGAAAIRVSLAPGA